MIRKNDPSGGKKRLDEKAVWRNHWNSHKGGLMSIIVALLLASTPAGSDAKTAQKTVTYAPVPAGKISTANPHSIAAYLQKEGFRAKLVTDDGSPFIESSSSGATFVIYLQNCEGNKACQDVMFRSSYDKKDENPIKVDAINSYNAENRWARAYLDKESNPVLEYDVLFTDQLVDEKMFGEAVTIWVEVLEKFHKAIDF